MIPPIWNVRPYDEAQSLALANALGVSPVTARLLAIRGLIDPDEASRFLKPSLDQLFTMRPVLGCARYRTPIAGLYLCGSGTHPGGGITAGSGQNASREILKDLKK